VRTISIPPVGLEGILNLPADARGIVLFAHGSGSSRLSPRNNYVAETLRRVGLATLLFDLLTEAEAADRAKVFDIGLLAERLFHATDWIRGDAEAGALRIGYFGASTGAGAALLADTLSESEIGAIVSRGGRPDLAEAALTKVRAPTLLIVGSLDTMVLELNQAALARLDCEKQLAVVPGATHLFEEPGTLDQVIALAQKWFTDHLAAVEQA
jgi:putative phosphoribosyl transferase